MTEKTDELGADELRDQIRNPWPIPTKSIRVEAAQLAVWPYIHVDVYALPRTPRPNRQFTFGVPLVHEEGMAFYCISEDSVEKYDDYRDAPHIDDMPELDKRCKFHQTEMVPTKHFNLDDMQRWQWKCPDCYLCAHAGDEHTAQEVGRELQKVEDDEVKQRLKDMGYL